MQPTHRQGPHESHVETHEVGALHQALAPFRRFKLNMTKIESRPSKRKAWEYYFFVDCEGHKDDRKVAKAIAELQRQCNFVKVLGSYPIRTDFRTHLVNRERARCQKFDAATRREKGEYPSWIFDRRATPQRRQGSATRRAVF